MTINDSNKRHMTTKQARAAYLKEPKHFVPNEKFIRQAERRELLEHRATEAKAKEKRAKANKLKREANEARAKATLERQIEQGRVRPEAALGKVSASQPRLNVFFGVQQADIVAARLDNGSPTVDGLQGGIPKSGGFESKLSLREASPITGIPADAHGFLSNGTQLPSIVSGYFDSEELAKCISSQDPLLEMTQMPISETGAATASNRQNLRMKPIYAVNDGNRFRTTAKHQQHALLSTQHFSSFNEDFPIAEDAEIEEEPRSEAQPHAIGRQKGGSIPVLGQNTSAKCTRKRKADDADSTFFAESSSKSARISLAEMSPSDVNVRAQERPAVSSPPRSRAVVLPNQRLRDDGSRQTLSDDIGWLSTQFFEDEEFGYNKENKDPWKAASRRVSQGGHQGKRKASDLLSKSNIRQSPSIGPKTAQNGRIECVDTAAVKDISMDDAFDESDYLDDELDDDVLLAVAALSSTAPHKNTVVTATGSPRRIRRHRPSAIEPKDSKQAEKGNSKCTRCNKHGHTEDKCWALRPGLNPYKRDGQKQEVAKMSAGQVTTLEAQSSQMLSAIPPQTTISKSSSKARVTFQGRFQHDPIPSELRVPCQDSPESAMTSDASGRYENTSQHLAMVTQAAAKDAYCRELPSATEVDSFGLYDLDEDDLAGVSAQFDGLPPSPPITEQHEDISRVIPWNHPSQFSGFTRFSQARSAGALSVIEGDAEDDWALEMQDPRTAIEEVEEDYRAHLRMEGERDAAATGGANAAATEDTVTPGDEAGLGADHASVTAVKERPRQTSVVALAQLGANSSQAGPEAEEMFRELSRCHSQDGNEYVSNELPPQPPQPAVGQQNHLSTINVHTKGPAMETAANANHEGDDTTRDMSPAPPRALRYERVGGTGCLGSQVAKAMSNQLLESLSEEDEFI